MDGVFWSTRLRGPDIASGALSVTLPRPRRAGCPSLHCPLAAELRIVRPLRGWRCRPRPRTRAGRRRVWPRRRRRGGALDLGPPSPAATPPAAAGRGGRRGVGVRGRGSPAAPAAGSPSPGADGGSPPSSGPAAAGARPPAAARLLRTTARAGAPPRHRGAEGPPCRLLRRRGPRIRTTLRPRRHTPGPAPARRCRPLRSPCSRPRAAAATTCA